MKSTPPSPAFCLLLLPPFLPPYSWWKLLILRGTGHVRSEWQPVNVWHAGETLSFVPWLSFFSLSLYTSGVPLQSFGWMLAILKPFNDDKLLTIYCSKEEKKRICYCVLLWLIILVLYFVSQWISFKDHLLIQNYYIFNEYWCTLSECLLCAVTCCRILCMVTVESIGKHVTGMPLLRAYTLVFKTLCGFCVSFRSCGLKMLFTSLSVALKGSLSNIMPSWTVKRRTTGWGDVGVYGWLTEQPWTYNDLSN